MRSPTTPAETNRAAALEWIDAFNARDDRREAASRTGDYIAHTPESIGTETLDSDGWVRFLGVFLEGFPDLHLEVQGASTDGHMVAQRILFTGTHTGASGPSADKPEGALLGHRDQPHGGRKGCRTGSSSTPSPLFQQLGLRVVPGPRLLPRLVAFPVRKLLRKRVGGRDSPSG